MKLKLKRVCAFCASVLMLASSALPASAVNYKDTTWNYDISYNQMSYTTEPRAKQDTSGTYVFYEGGTPASLRCDVLNASGTSMCRKIGSIGLGKKGLIAQYVYENGYRSARLKVTAPSSTTYGGAEGVWSPDSVGSYPYINL